MDAGFWQRQWRDHQIGFHQSQFNSKLMRYFPELESAPGADVVVPLCGKSRDMLWLQGQGFHVTGVELSTIAIEAFFSENHLDFQRKGDWYVGKQIRLFCGNFFDLEPPKDFSIAYDRASLIALPPSLRIIYAQTLSRWLLPGGRCLLLSIEYDQGSCEGPPFSVEEAEIRSLFHAFHIKKLDSCQEKMNSLRMRKAGVKAVKENVYFLEKKF